MYNTIDRFDMTAEKATLQTLENGFEIINEIQANEGATLTHLSEKLDLPPSTVHRYLKTLESMRYIIRRDNAYYLGLRFLDHGIHVRNRQPGYSLLEERTVELAEETEERAQFLVYEYGRGVHLCNEVGKRSVQTESRVGKRVHLHSTAAGKCILTALPEDERETLLSELDLPKQTANTITDADVLREELKTVNDRGYAINDEERIVGLRSVGVPITGENDQLIGAMSISGPTNRMRDDRMHTELSQSLLEVAGEIKLKMTYSS